jgi:hypothetical protein
MGVVQVLAQLLFGNGQNVVKETAEVFMENTENGSIRSASLRAAAMDQFDRFMSPRWSIRFGSRPACKGSP